MTYIFYIHTRDINENSMKLKKQVHACMCICDIFMCLHAFDRERMIQPVCEKPAKNRADMKRKTKGYLELRTHDIPIGIACIILFSGGNKITDREE